MRDPFSICPNDAYRIKPECTHPTTEPRWAVLHDGLGRVIGQSDELTYCTACGAYIGQQPPTEEDV